jgi:hypothetical protein
MEKRNPDGSLSQTWLEKGFELTDRLLKWCEDNQMYLVLDMHGAPGGQGKNASISDYDPEKPSLWESEENKDKLVALWVRLAERYKDSQWIGGFDLINEPNWALDEHQNQNGCECENNDAIWNLHERIIKAIRKVNKNHIVYISGNCWGGNYRSFEDHSLKAADSNMVITFHKYWNNNKPDAIDKWLKMRETYQLPLWMSEGGENSNTWFSDCIGLYEQHKVGWSWWPVKKSKVNNILKVKTDKSYIELIDSWEKNEPLPAGDTYAAVMGYAKAHKFDNCIIAKDVIFALTKQVRSSLPEPYVKHRVDQEIKFADYDMGRDGFAYHDQVSADYHVDDGSDWAQWNSGGFYRNDGVDIGQVNGVPYVGWTEKGEWLTYTVDNPEEGLFTLELKAASPKEMGIIGIEVNGVVLNDAIEIPLSDSAFDWKPIRVNEISLPQGTLKFRIYIKEGGSNLLSFRLTPSNQESNK